MKIREFKENNYRAIFYNNKTIRLKLDNTKPITELKYPEFYDVKLTSFCQGNCPYCYMDSKSSDKQYENVLKKIENFFGCLSDNQKPFQIAYGGGNPNQHPDFIKVLEKTVELGIVPNYTTNGMGLTDEILEATTKYCGGVAVSTHPHLYKIWTEAVNKFSLYGVETNLHIIISDKESIDSFLNIYSRFQDKIKYFNDIWY